MMRSQDNRQEMTKSAAQFLLMILTKEEDRILGLRTLRILISIQRMGTKIIKNPNTKMVKTQRETELQT